MINYFPARRSCRGSVDGGSTKSAASRLLQPGRQRSVDHVAADSRVATYNMGRLVRSSHRQMVCHVSELVCYISTHIGTCRT